MMSKKLKKNRTRIDIPKGQLIQSFDIDAFKDLYEKWKDECKSVSVNQLGMKASHPKPKRGLSTLLDVVWSHGEIGRTRSKSPETPVSPPAGGELVESLDKFIEGDKGIEKDDFKIVKEKLILLQKYLKMDDKNPAHISFEVPDWSTVNRKTLDHDTVTVFGHYRTPDYVKYRNLKARVKDNDKYAEDMPAVPTQWYSETAGSAKPPLWQALFGKGGDDVISDSKGLLKVLQAAMKMLRGIQIEYLELKVLDTGTADEIWKIPHLRREILKQVWANGRPGGEPNPDGISSKTGNFRDWSLTKWFNNQIWTPENIKESEMIKEALDAEEYAGKVKKYKVKISRRQMRHIGMLCGLKWKKRGETVWLPREEKGEEKEAMDFSKSWRDTLSVA